MINSVIFRADRFLENFPFIPSGFITNKIFSVNEQELTIAEIRSRFFCITDFFNASYWVGLFGLIIYH